MQLLNPHTIQNICFLTFHVSRLTALHQDNLESCLLQRMEESLPVAAGTFHSYGSDLVRLQMLNEPLMVPGIHTKLSYVSRDLIHCYPVGFRSDVDTGGILMDNFQGKFSFFHFLRFEGEKKLQGMYICE